jgi:hypothetical protein
MAVTVSHGTTVRAGPALRIVEELVRGVGLN